MIFLSDFGNKNNNNNNNNVNDFYSQRYGRGIFFLYINHEEGMGDVYVYRRTIKTNALAEMDVNEMI